jgi:hypothetical protein
VQDISGRLALLAGALEKAGDLDEGLRLLDEALVMAEFTGERYFEAELYRLKGEQLLMQAGGRGASALASAEGCFNQSIEIARRQKAKSLELRAAMSLARLWHERRPLRLRRPVDQGLPSGRREPDGPLCAPAGSSPADLSETNVTVRFLADEDLSVGIIQALHSREPAIDILDVKTAGFRGMKDPMLLELAAQGAELGHDGLEVLGLLHEGVGAGGAAGEAGLSKHVPCMSEVFVLSACESRL